MAFFFHLSLRFPTYVSLCYLAHVIRFFRHVSDNRMRHRDRSSVAWWWMTCFCVVLFLPGSTAGPPYSYTVFQGVDAPGSVSTYLSHKHIATEFVFCLGYRKCQH